MKKISVENQEFTDQVYEFLAGRGVSDKSGIALMELWARLPLTDEELSLTAVEIQKGFPAVITTGITLPLHQILMVVEDV